ncbi:MAG: SLBB domain-containing protein [Planctomycetes bacterium]|nr:SLBB domain-containing protein [Planctomycetota bacterium]
MVHPPTPSAPDAGRRAFPREFDPRAAGLAAALVALAGCGGGPPRAFSPEDARPDPRRTHAKVVARSGVPSPTPQLDAMAAALSRTTPELGLEALLAGHEDRLQPGDQVQVTCLSLPELSGLRTVGQDGRVEGPVELITATGLTPKELAARIEAQLASTYTQRGTHQVSVRLIERSGRTVEVIGRVGAHAAGQGGAGAAAMTTVYPLPLDRSMGVYELLSLAHGAAADADVDRLLLLRQRGKPSPGGASGPVVYHFSVRELVDAQLAGREAWLLAGDQLIVPRLPDVFVYGEVVAPGRYTWRPGLTVASLLLIAGGATPEADPLGGLIFSEDAERPAAPGDPLDPAQVLFVPQVQRVYVVGPGVKNNGPLVLPAGGMSAVQAISEAGWFTQFGKPSGVKIFRRGDEGRRVTIDVPVDDVLDGDRDEREFLLQPGDHIFVPEGMW